MRIFWTYRGVARNHFRDAGFLDVWKSVPYAAAHANTVAKLQQRALQCAHARYLVQVVRNSLGRFTWHLSVNQALTNFWNGQPFTRIRSRILKQLAQPPHPCLMFR